MVSMSVTDQVCGLGQSILVPVIQYPLLKITRKIGSEFMAKVKLNIYHNSWPIERTVLMSATINRKAN